MRGHVKWGIAHHKHSEMEHNVGATHNKVSEHPVVASFDESWLWLLSVPQMSMYHSAPELMCKGAWSLSMKINIPTHTLWQGWLYHSPNQEGSARRFLSELLGGALPVRAGIKSTSMTCSRDFKHSSMLGINLAIFFHGTPKVLSRYTRGMPMVPMVLSRYTRGMLMGLSGYT